MARQISLPSFMSSKRAKVATVAVAGTLTLAAAISAAAVTAPSPFPAAATADTAFMTGMNQAMARSAQATVAGGSQQAAAFQQVPAYQAKQVQQQAAAAKAVAARAAAAKAAAMRAAAQRAAAQKAAAQKAAAAKAAQEAAAQQAAQQAATQQAATQQAATPQATAQPTQQAQPASATAVTAPSGSAEQIAEQMLSQFGWSTSQFSCLQPLWQQESGWSVTAENPSSGAYGIPQALPGSKMASAGADWQTDAATQISWGLTYIKDLYGSPCGAWAHEEADGWY